MRTLIALLCLAGSAVAADWHTLTIEGQTIVAVSDDAVRLSTDRGRHFKTIAVEGVHTVAARPRGAYVAAYEGVWWITPQGAQTVRMPGTAQVIRDLRAGPGWLMVIADSPSPGLSWTVGRSHHRVAVWVRKKGRWRQLFKHIPSRAENALTTLKIGPKGHAIASVIFTAACGGISVGDGEIWHPNRPAKQLPEGENGWESPAGIHRDWILTDCPKAFGHRACLYDTQRSALPLPSSPGGELTNFQVSPDARWVAVSDSQESDETHNIHVYERGTIGWVGYRSDNGQIIGARNDGITIRSGTTIRRVGARVETLGSLPRDVVVEMDARGRVYALIDDEMVMLKGGKEVVNPAF